MSSARSCDAPVRSFARSVTHLLNQPYPYVRAQVTFGNNRFCRSKCFEQAHEFEEKCKDKMTKQMSEGLSKFLPYMSACAHMVVRTPGEKWSKIKCDVALENSVIEADCGEVTNGAAMPCEHKCARTLKQMSNKCTEEPEFTKYEAVQKRCRGKHNDRQCKNVASRFTKIFQKSCCGKDECAKGLPPKCGASCADGFLPYFSRCGSAQYGDKLKQFGEQCRQ